MDVPHVFIIVLDTLREDYSEPVWRVLRNYGFLRYSAFATSPWTLPSHASMFTGMYPLYHGAHETKTRKARDIRLNVEPQLTHELADLGYRTVLLSANPYISPYFGFSGFETYIPITMLPKWFEEFFLLSREEEEALVAARARAGLWGMVTSAFRHPRAALKKFGRFFAMMVFSKLRGWPLEKGSRVFVREIKGMRFETPTFVFVNLVEAHEPYVYPDRLLFHENLLTGRLDQKHLARWKEVYPKEAELLARRMDQFLGMLSARGVLENSVIIITSDHGQLLGEHGHVGHGVFLYDELLRVPFFVRGIALDVRGPLSLKDVYHIVVEGVGQQEVRIENSCVFAESFGVQDRLTPATREEQERLARWEQYRIRILTDGCSGIFNVSKWTWESKGCNGRLDKHVLRYLRGATIKGTLREEY